MNLSILLKVNKFNNFKLSINLINNLNYNKDNKKNRYILIKDRYVFSVLKSRNENEKEDIILLYDF